MNPVSYAILALSLSPTLLSQSLCTPVSVDHRTHRQWSFDLDVTDPAGVELTSLDLLLDYYHGGVEVFYRPGTHDGFDHNIAGWTSIANAVPTPLSGDWRRIDVEDTLLSPGIWGIAIILNGSYGYQTDAPVANNDLTIQNGMTFSERFHWRPGLYAKIPSMCVNYGIGPMKVVDVGVVSPGSIAVPHTMSPPDMYGHSTHATNFLYRYPIDTNVVTVAFPNVNTDGEMLECIEFDEHVYPAVTTLMFVTSEDGRRIRGVYEPPYHYDTEFGAPLSMGDETLATGLDLGFDFPLSGGNLTTDRIDISSNGFIWLVSGSSTETDPTPGGIEFDTEPARLCALWRDLTFSGGLSDVWFKTDGTRATITWRRASVPGSTDQFSAQCQISKSGRISLSYTGALPDSGLTVVGWTPGNGSNFDFVDFSTGFDTATNPALMEAFFFENDLDGAVFTALRNGNGGYVCDTLEGFGAESDSYSYGSGCPTPGSFLQFGTSATLGGHSFELAPNHAYGYDVEHCETSCYDPALGSQVAIGDDDLVTVDLPFSFAFPGGGATSSVSVCSNGFVWLRASESPNSNYTPNESEFFEQPARIAPFWCDLNPTDPSSDGLYVKSLADRVVVTWHDIVEFGTTNAVTAQCTLFADGRVTLAYGDLTIVGRDVLTGFTVGNGEPPTPASDLVAATPFRTSAPGGAALTLELERGWRALAGETVPLRVSNVGEGTTAGAMFVGFQEWAIDLDFIGAPSCFLLNSVDVTLPFATSGAFASCDVDLPDAVGLHLNVQAAVITPGINALGVATSNGIGMRLGRR